MGSQDCRAVADGNHAMKRRPARLVDDGLHGQRLFVKSDSDCPIAPRVIELLAAIRGEHEFDPKLLGRGVERA
jgi:hypothetical protein